MNADEQAIRAIHERWIEAVNAGDLDSLLGMIADDVVLINPGQEPFGREGFIAGFTGAHERLLLRCVSEPDEIVVSGDMAYTRCTDSLSIQPRAGGEPTRLSGHRLTVYRRQPDGRWLLARDAHTLQPDSSA
ncbi:YybH family protein [Burkholderiaceae bacterium UC74_6]